MLGEHFGREEAGRHSESLRQRKWFIKARQDQERRTELNERHEDSAMGFAADAAIATQIQVAEFRARIDDYSAQLDFEEAKLDAYDTAIVEALMENQLLLDHLYEQREAMLANAFVLEDGRRVFRTADGSTVFDEFGEEVGVDVIDPAHIADEFTTHEVWTGNQDSIVGAEVERADLLDAQSEIDVRREGIAAAREGIESAESRLEEGGLTDQELDELDAEISALMPPSASMTLPTSAMRHLTNPASLEAAPSASEVFSSRAAKVSTAELNTVSAQPSPVL